MSQVEQLEAKLKEALATIKSQSVKIGELTGAAEGKRSFFEVCRAGDVDAVRAMISAGKATCMQAALPDACASGSLEVVHEILKPYPETSTPKDWDHAHFDEALSGAAEAAIKDETVGKKIIVLLLSLGATNLQLALRKFCLAGKAPMIEYIFTVAASRNYRFDFSDAATCAAAGGHRDICVQIMSEGKALGHVVKINDILHGASSYAQLEMVQFAIDRKTTDFDTGLINVSLARLKKAPMENILAVMALMLLHGAKNAASVFRLPRDSSLVEELVTKKKVPRQSLIGIVGIEKLFAELDAAFGTCPKAGAARCTGNVASAVKDAATAGKEKSDLSAAATSLAPLDS
jgi:hypothetical protein